MLTELSRRVRILQARTAICALLFCVLCPMLSAQWKTTVASLPNEDVVHPCEYEMEIAPGIPSVAGVFAVFERGPQSHTFYNDPDVRAFATKHRLAMLLALHCPARQGEDMDVDPEKGLGRALFAALDLLAVQSKHAELRSAPVVVIGFSGAGALAARIPAYAPGRTAAAIVSHAGQLRPLGLNTIHLSPASLAVPQLVIVGGQDRIVGTADSYDYFRRHWLSGAPWLFATQNKAAHCCTIDAKPLILSWLDDVIAARSAKRALLQSPGGSHAYFRQVPTRWVDGGALPVQAGDLTIRRTSVPRAGEWAAGWLPSKETAALWRSFAEREPSKPAATP